MGADVARGAKAEAPDACESFEVSAPFKEKDATKTADTTRRVLTWKTENGKRVEAESTEGEDKNRGEKKEQQNKTEIRE